MEAVPGIIDSMNLPIHKPTKQSMKRYVEGVMREARNFSVLRASEFLNFSYQRLQCTTWKFIGKDDKIGENESKND